MTDRQKNLWSEVDAYVEEVLGADDPILVETLEVADREGLPRFGVSSSQGRFLATLVQMIKARFILEIGTLAGYSTIHLARAAGPEGEVVTIEYDSHHAHVAQANFARAGLTEQVEVRIGAAADILPVLYEELRPKFDFVFIDADKINSALYAKWALKLTRPGGVVVVDNVVRDGRLIDEHSTDPSVTGSRAVLDYIADINPAAASVIQTVGSKGHDGFAIFVVPEQVQI